MITLTKLKILLLLISAKTPSTNLLVFSNSNIASIRQRALMSNKSHNLNVNKPLLLCDRKFKSFL